MSYYLGVVIDTVGLFCGDIFVDKADVVYLPTFMNDILQDIFDAIRSIMLRQYIPM